MAYSTPCKATTWLPSTRSTDGCSGSSVEGASDVRLCCGRVNRGVAILGTTIFVAEADNHLIAIDSRTGKAIWNRTVAKTSSGYSMTGAPLALRDKVIVGIAGGEYGVRGFIEAFDARTGKEDWRFYTIPAP